MSAWQCRHRYNRLAFALTSFSRSDFQKNFRIYSFKNYQLTTSPISNAFPRKKGSSYHKMNPWKLCDKVFDKVFNYSSFYLVIRDFWDPLSIKLSPSNSSLLNVPELWIRTYNILVIQVKNKVDCCTDDLISMKKLFFPRKTCIQDLFIDIFCSSAKCKVLLNTRQFKLINTWSAVLPLTWSHFKYSSFLKVWMNSVLANCLK